MNPLLITCAVTGFLHLLLLVWATVSGFHGSMAISGFCLMLCVIGHRYTAANLT